MPSSPVRGGSPGVRSAAPTRVTQQVLGSEPEPSPCLLAHCRAPNSRLRVARLLGVMGAQVLSGQGPWPPPLQREAH